jgi:multidrug efflux pump subunit AcrB
MPSHAVITPFRMVLLFIIATALGLLALPQLDVNWLPAKKNARIHIGFSYPGSSPDIVEQQVTTLLEGALSQVSQLKGISSVSYHNRGSITLLFDEQADIQFTQLQIASIIRRIYPSLPFGCTYPFIFSGTARQENPFLVYNISLPAQSFEANKEATEIFQKMLAGMPGIREVSVSGMDNMQLAVEYDINKCRALGISTQVIASHLQAYSASFYPGSIRTAAGNRYFLKMPPGLLSVTDVERLLLPNQWGQAIALKEVARVFLEEATPATYFRVNGKNAVRLNITAREGENKIALANGVRSLLQSKQRSLPAGYSMQLEYDESTLLSAELRKNYRRAGLSIIFLALFIMLAYRNWRYMLVLFCGLLVTLSLTTTLVFVFGLHIHLYTIAGLAIAFGIITDNGIVMIDYYHRHRNRKFFTALLGASLTTMSALGLVFLLPSEDRHNLDDFAAIIMLTLISSMLVALWFIPGLYDLLFSSTAPGLQKNYASAKKRYRVVHAYYKLCAFAAAYRKTFIACIILLFGIPVFLLPAKWEGNGWYHDVYNRSIGSEQYQQYIRPHTDKWLGGTMRQFVVNMRERAGFRDPGRTKLLVSAELTFGNTPLQMNGLLEKVEALLEQVQGIDKYVTNVYSGQHGNIEISFREGFDKSSLPHKLKSALIARALNWGGAEWNIEGAGPAFSNTGIDEMPGFRVAMRGYNYDELEKQAVRLRERLLQHKRIQQVNINDRLEYGEGQSLEYVLELNEAGMALSGTSSAEVMVHAAELGMPAMPQQYLALDNNFYAVMLRESGSGQYSNYSLLNQPLVLDSGRQVRIKDFADMKLRSAASSIHRENRQYIRIISFEYMGAAHFGEEFLQQVLDEMKMSMPAGYMAERDEWKWGISQAGPHYLLVALLVTAVFVICSILFEDLRQPFYIILMIPVSFIGLFMVFAWGGYYFDQGGYAALIMLGGLAANAAIYIVNDFNNLRKERPARMHNRLLVKAAAGRARTTLLAVMSACCGLLPFLAGGQDEVFWFSLAAGAIGGLVFSLFAVLIVLPVLLWKKSKF